MFYSGNKPWFAKKICLFRVIPIPKSNHRRWRLHLWGLHWAIFSFQEPGARFISIYFFLKWDTIYLRSEKAFLNLVESWLFLLLSLGAGDICWSGILNPLLVFHIFWIKGEARKNRFRMLPPRPSQSHLNFKQMLGETTFYFCLHFIIPYISSRCQPPVVLGPPLSPNVVGPSPSPPPRL